jgi:predicted transcriptional regulator
MDLTKLLLKNGVEDFLITDLEVARKLTGKRLELLKTIEKEEVGSVQELADETGRNWANVSNDLDLLAQEGFVEFVREGRRKKPVLCHGTVLVKPISLNEQ